MAGFCGVAMSKNDLQGALDLLVLKTLAQMGEAHRSRSRGFISFRLKGDSWWRVPTDSPNQPPDGFTVASYEDDEELETLCHTYEQADEEGRRLIRLVAELSVVQNRKA